MLKKKANFWWRCGEMVTFIHWWWEYELPHPSWKIICWYLQIFKHICTLTQQKVFLKKHIIHTRMFCAALFVCGEDWQWVVIKKEGTSLVAQWIRIHLPMQGTRVWSLVRGKSHMLRSDWARMPQLQKPARLEPMLCNKRSYRHKPTHCNEE